MSVTNVTIHKAAATLMYPELTKVNEQTVYEVKLPMLHITADTYRLHVLDNNLDRY